MLTPPEFVFELSESIFRGPELNESASWDVARVQHCRDHIAKIKIVRMNWSSRQNAARRMAIEKAGGGRYQHLA